MTYVSFTSYAVITIWLSSTKNTNADLAKLQKFALRRAIQRLRSQRTNPKGLSDLGTSEGLRQSHEFFSRDLAPVKAVYTQSQAKQRGKRSHIQGVQNVQQRMKVNKYHRDFYNKTHRPSLLHSGGTCSLGSIFAERGGIGSRCCIEGAPICKFCCLLCNNQQCTKNVVSHVFLDCKVTYLASGERYSKTRRLHTRVCSPL